MANHSWQEDSQTNQLSPLGSQSILSPYSLDPSYLPPEPEFIFPVEIRKKSWNEKMFERTGTGYMTGVVVGGTWGLWEGIRHPEARTFRTRMNRIINGCTRRGPFLGNTLAVIALLYSPLESGIGNIRGVDDNINSIAAATISGLIYKSTAGLRAMGLASAIGCSAVGLYIGLNIVFNGQGSMLYSY